MRKEECVCGVDGDETQNERERINTDESEVRVKQKTTEKG